VDNCVKNNNQWTIFNEWILTFRSGYALIIVHFTLIIVFHIDNCTLIN